RGRPAVVGALVAAAAFAAVPLVGNQDAAASEAALRAHAWTRAEAAAQRARLWQPWSTRPLRELGDARFGRGDFAGAAGAYRAAGDVERQPESRSGVTFDRKA